MATNESRPRTISDEHEPLTEEQIEALLQEAETRLRRKSNLELEKTTRDEKKITIPKVQHDLPTAKYIQEQNGVAKADPGLLMSNEQKRMADGLRSVVPAGRHKKANDETDAGSSWFNLPKTTVTPELKRDLQIIELRSVLDPHRHYKKSARKGRIPTFSQVGTVIEGPTEWYSGRINKKDRSKNFVEETMKTEAENGKFKRKYAEVQNAKTSGKKAHYKKLMQKRRKQS